MGGRRRVPALDGLRGMAVAAVLLFHGGHLDGGFLGVDLFFVLSGFLITTLLLDEAATGRIDIRQFWARRARRLLPALAVVLVAIAGYALLYAGVDELHRIRFDGLATAFYFANWRAVVAPQTYWELFAKPSPLEHTWSLAIEEQFYLLWPLLIAGVVAWCARARRAVAPTVFALSIALGAASLAAMQLLYHPTDTNRAYFGTDSRASSILVGAALAALLAWRGSPRSDATWRVINGASLIGAAVLGFAWVTVDGTTATAYRGGFFVCALAAAAIIVGTTAPRPTALDRVLAVPPLVGLGVISYGVYLWHWPVFVFLDEDRVSIRGWWLFLLRVVITIAIAIVSYVVIEHPVRRRAFRPGTLRRVTPAVASLVVLALLASTISTSAHPPLADLRPDTPQVALAAAAVAPPASTKLLLVGNSVAFLLADGFKAVTPDPPVVVNAALPSCIFPPGVTRLRDQAKKVLPLKVYDCTTDWATDLEQFRPDVVLLVMGDFGDGAYERDGRWIEPCTPEFDDWYRDSLATAAADLGATGARVAIATSAYSYGVFGASRFAKDDCVNAIDRQVVATIPNAILIDLAAYVCPTPDSCVTQLDGVELRPDGVHYRDESARLIAQWILPQLTARH